LAQPLQQDEFAAFVERSESRLRIALVAMFGQEDGRDAAASALAYGWEHWEKVSVMDNPVGYLYRVGQSSQRQRRQVRWAPVPNDAMPHIEPGLPAAIGGLSPNQRIAVVLIHAYGWDRAEVANLIQASVSSVDTHLSRGLTKLRNSLGVEAHA
jgi:RNA polymerase sigma-70 factor (ECF subfamily)